MWNTIIGSWSKFYFSNFQGDSVNVDGLNDNKDFHAVEYALDVCDFSATEQEVSIII